MAVAEAVDEDEAVCVSVGDDETLGDWVRLGVELKLLEPDPDGVCEELGEGVGLGVTLAEGVADALGVADPLGLVLWLRELLCEAVVLGVCVGLGVGEHAVLAPETRTEANDGVASQDEPSELPNAATARARPLLGALTAGAFPGANHWTSTLG